MVDTSTPTTSDQQPAGNPINANAGYENLVYNLDPEFQNPLNVYQTYNYLFTLAVLPKDKYNTGELPYPSQFPNILIRSQGDWGNVDRVVTEFGEIDFYMDDLIIDTDIWAGANKGTTISSNISFTITEPYSVGLFYEALAIAAGNSGFQQQTEAVLILGIEFAGYNDGDIPYIDPSLTRYITLRLVKAAMTVTHAGCIYSVTAVGSNESPVLEPATGETQTTIQMKGTTVRDFLTDDSPKSLKAAIKTMYSQFRKDHTLDSPDEFDIRIIDNPALPGVANTIASSLLFKDLNSGGSQPQKERSFFYEAQKKLFNDPAITLLPDRSVFVAKGTPIGKIITDVILQSDYINNQVQGGQFQTDAMGMINWFGVRARSEEIGPAPQLNRNNKLVIWEIFPFKVHIFKFLPPGTASPGFDELKRGAARVYNYIYTGDNTEIIRWDIVFDFGFTSLIPVDVSTNSFGDISNILQNAGIDLTSIGIPKGNMSSSSEFSPRVSPTGNESIIPKASSAGAERSKTVQARVLQGMLDDLKNLATIELQIRGDPFWFSNDITGNAVGRAQTYNTMQDNTVNLWSGQTNIVANFRNPIDLDPVTGLYKFSAQADTISGIFWINHITHSFSRGKFTQVIKGPRMTGQQGSSAVVGGAGSMFPSGMAGAGFQFAGALFKSLLSSFNFGGGDNVDGGAMAIDDNSGGGESFPDAGTTSDNGDITI